MAAPVAEKPGFIKTIAPWVGIVVGSIAAAYGYAALVMPNNMLEGGVTGIGMMANRVAGLPAGVTGLLLTVGFFVAGIKILGKGFGARTVVATLLVSFGIDFFHSVLKVHALTNDKLLAAFYGGALCGAGLGLVYQAGAATGGADALAQILRKLFGYPIGKTLLVIDAMVLGAAIYFYGAEQVMYSLVMIFIEVKVMDLILHGARANQMITIISVKPNPISDKILNELGRGLTVYRAQGGFTGAPKSVLQTVVARKQVPIIRRLIAEVDRKAFVMVSDVDECYGEGFERLPRPGLRFQDSRPSTTNC